MANEKELKDIEALAALKQKLMDYDIDTKIEKLMEEFTNEIPNGDSFDLAKFMYKRGCDTGFQDGFKAGKEETC